MSKYRKIEFVALRDNLGATGGPGGVLYIQQQLLGSNLCGLNTVYRYNYLKTRNKKFSSARRVFNMLLFFFHFLFEKKTYYIAHDVETGRILASLNKDYSMIFHHQGSVVKERTELAGKELSQSRINYFQKAEREALTHATSLHFPSNGAAEMYFVSDYATCNKEEVRLGVPLYNVILPPVVKEPDDFCLKYEPSMLTFFSLGTLTKAKGQDQTVDFLSKFVPAYKKSVRYILLGKGPLHDKLIQKLDEIKESNTNFNYTYIDALPHNAVMYLHKISDVYIMLHRVSIFDFATLEAMSQNSAVILSKVGGNPEYNRENNIIFADDVVFDEREIEKYDFEALKVKNKEVFDKYFSPEAFRNQYESLISSVN